MIADLHDEADLCLNDGANDIADLLDRAIAALQEPTCRKLTPCPRCGDVVGKCDGATSVKASPVEPAPVELTDLHITGIAQNYFLPSSVVSFSRELIAADRALRQPKEPK